MRLGLPMEPALSSRRSRAGIAAVVFGWFCVRLSGVYLAMLTLAFAQIAWSVAFQWVEVTGGDNGVFGVWPSAGRRRQAVYYFYGWPVRSPRSCSLRIVMFAPFGYACARPRFGRCGPRRSASVRASSGSPSCWRRFAGLAGGLFAFSKGSVFPTIWRSRARSTA
jgi:branched-chain amino acid transport system permease protein